MDIRRSVIFGNIAFLLTVGLGVFVADLPTIRDLNPLARIALGLIGGVTLILGLWLALVGACVVIGRISLRLRPPERKPPLARQ